MAVAPGCGCAMFGGAKLERFFALLCRDKRERFHGAATEFQETKVRQALDMDQAGIGDPRAVEVQPFNGLDGFQMRQPRIGNGRAIEGEELQAGQPGNVDHAGIGDPYAVEFQVPKQRQPFQAGQAGVGDFRARQVQYL